MDKTFKLVKKVVLYAFSILLLLSCAAYIYLYVLPKGPEITATRKIKIGIDSFVIPAYKDSGKKSIRVWTYKPENWKDQERIIFVMHGGGRNADDYLNAWVELANENNLLIVAPEFENKFSKYTTNDYQEGNLFTFFGTKNPKSEWAYAVVENIFDHIKSANDITNGHYDIFGHSAGGQFVHRMTLLYPESRVKTAIAANAGLYTFIDQSVEYPYGVKNIELQSGQVKNAFEKQLVLMTGELDNSPDLGTFTTTDLAMRQGDNRLERGAYFFEYSKEYAAKNKFTFNWKLDTVKNVGHDYKKMAESSMDWLKNFR